jgi:hypothetical protein
VDALLRLAWALPLVLIVGVAAMLVLRQVMTRRETAPPGPRMRVGESLRVNDDTTVHLLEIDRQSYVLVESTHQTQLAPLAQPAAQASAPRGVPFSWQRLVRVRS